jgi:hypothetical protein
MGNAQCRKPFLMTEGEKSSQDDNPRARKQKEFEILIHQSAKVLKNLNFFALWDNFLLSGAESTALCWSDARQIMLGSFFEDVKYSKEEQQVLIDSYLDHLKEITDPPLGPKQMDFMATICATLMLSKSPDSVKIDEMYKLITLEFIETTEDSLAQSKGI